jgi:hypothetical protein
METIMISEDYIEPDKEIGDYVYLIKYPKMTQSLYLLEDYDYDSGEFTATKQIIH